MLDLTKPGAPYEPFSYLQGEAEFVKLQGQDFIDPESRKGKSRHYRRGNPAKIASHVLAYSQHLPDDRRFFQKQPGKMISTQEIILEWNKETSCFIEYKHDPSFGLTTPPFPFKYIPWESISEDQSKLVLKYFKNLSPENERDKFALFLGFLIGYTLTPYRIKKLFIVVGEGDTGKTGFH